MLTFDLHLLIRYLHIAAMALMLGGALLLWGLSVRGGATARDTQSRLLLFGARRYEVLFWLALGALVMTGVGNLGTFGTGLPPPATAWGGKLMLKLALVLLFVLLSLARTLLVVRLGAAQTDIPVALPVVVRYLYAGTTLFTLAILFVAVALSHGG